MALWSWHGMEQEHLKRRADLDIFHLKVSTTTEKRDPHKNTSRKQTINSHIIPSQQVHYIYTFSKNPITSYPSPPPTPYSPLASKPSASNSNTSCPHSPAKTSSSVPPKPPQTNIDTTPSPFLSNLSSRDGRR